MTVARVSTNKDFNPDGNNRMGDRAMLLLTNPNEL